MTIEELQQAYAPEGVYAGMTQAEALRHLAKRYLRKPECVALCNEVANNLTKLLKVVEAHEALQARCDELRDELYQLKLLICGGEDAPGHANTLTLRDADEIIATLRSDETDYAHLQARYDKLEAAARDLLDNAEPKWGDKVVVHRSVIEALSKALEVGA